MIDRLNNVFNLAAQAVRTFKPVRYDPVERKLLTSDKNNDKKFAFITQETVVDYRSVEVSQFYFFFSLLSFYYIIAGFANRIALPYVYDIIFTASFVHRFFLFCAFLKRCLFVETLFCSIPLHQKVERFWRTVVD